jgi:hypothetical protein
MANQGKTVSHDYYCDGPFTFGTGVCVHGWNCPHTLDSAEAWNTDRLYNCGLLPARQRIEKYEP